MMNIDHNKLHELVVRPRQLAEAHDLRRDGDIFFVGGDLPVNETLETMFDSFCMESTELFYLTFGDLGSFPRGVEMARQIKKNFNVRLMGKLDFVPTPQILERIYAAGVDILDIHLDPAAQSFSEGAEMSESCRALLEARSVFTRWSVAATMRAGEVAPEIVVREIDALLKEGIMPLVAVSGQTVAGSHDRMDYIFRHLAAGWKRFDVPLKPYLPLISHMTPLVSKKQAGMLRNLIDKFQDRQQLVASDLRRHLRVSQVEDSLDSAAL